MVHLKRSTHATGATAHGDKTANHKEDFISQQGSTADDDSQTPGIIDFWFHDWLPAMFLQRAVSRKQPGTLTVQKRSGAGLGRITGLPVSGSDYQHMLTTQLTKQFGIIDLADLKLPGLIQNHHLAQAVASAPLAEVSRQCQ